MLQRKELGRQPQAEKMSSQSGENSTGSSIIIRTEDILCTLFSGLTMNSAASPQHENVDNMCYHWESDNLSFSLLTWQQDKDGNTIHAPYEYRVRDHIKTGCRLSARSTNQVRL